MVADFWSSQSICVELFDKCLPGKVTVDQDMCAWFDANVTQESSHAGRWRRDFDADTCAQIDEAYLASCERLVSAGVQLPSGE